MIKDVLKEARTRKGLKQEDVASRIKIAKQTYLKWENGTTEPKASQIAALAEVLEITPNEICSGRLYKRYPLDQFIFQLSRHGARAELEILRYWEHIPDHQGFFESLEKESEDDFDTERYINEISR